MPFTVSHVAVVLPLRNRAGLTTLPLVLGAIVPDLPMIVGLPDWYDRTHSYLGAVTVDLALALLLAVVWVYWAGEPVLAALPPALRRRLPARPQRLPFRSWRERRAASWWVASAALAALTHVVLDLFTHEDRARQIWEGLDDRVLRLTVADWLQYVLGALGLVVLIVHAVWWVRSRPPLPTSRTSPPAVVPRRWAWVAWGVLVGTSVVLAVLRGLEQAVGYPRGVHFRYQYIQISQHAAFGLLSGPLLALVLLGGAWWWLGRRRRA